MHLEEMLYGYFGHDVMLEVANFHWPPGGVFFLVFAGICKPPGGEY